MRAKSLSIVMLGSTLLAAVALSGLRTSSPAAAAAGDRPVTGYTLLSPSTGSQCQLATVDWATGVVTDLPAGPSDDACAYDLAAAPDGTVYGFAGNVVLPGGAPSSAPAAVSEVGHLVTFAPDGTPTRTTVQLPQPYLQNLLITSFIMGLAIDERGTFNLLVNGLWADVTTCEPALAPTNLPEGTVDVTDGIDDWVPCLFTLDPTTGALTLVGSTRLLAGDFAGLSIGSAGTWSLGLPGTHSSGPVSTNDPSEGPPSVAYWSSIDRATGESTLTAATYPISNSLYDQLRTRPTVFAFLRDPEREVLSTGTVDPTTGVITKIADVQFPSSALTPVLAVVEGPEPEPEIPKFTG